MNSLIGAGDGTRIQGFVEIEKISTKDNVRKVYKNTITSTGKQLLLAKSAGLMLGMSGDIFGKTGVSNQIMRTSSNTTSPRPFRHSRKDADINNVLLNLDDNVLAGLGVSTSFVNVWDEEFKVADKVVGYASSEVNPTNDGKEGKLDHCLGEYMVDPYTVAKRWKYDENTANGTFNCIAMMPGAIINSPYGDGIKFSKCIDKVNVQDTTFSKMSSGFLIPGIPGYTANNEVLLNFEKDGVSRWKYNIGTGEVTQVPDTDNFFIPHEAVGNNPITDMQYIDGFLYVMVVDINGSYETTYVYVFDVANGMAQLSYFSLNTAVSYPRTQRASIFKYNGKIYVSLANRDTVKDGVYKLYELTVGSGGYATGVANRYTDYSELGFTVPSGLVANVVGVGAYGSNYVAYVPVRMKNEVDDSELNESGADVDYKVVGYVFTDMADPFNSIIDMIPGLTPSEVLFNTGAISGTLRVGFNKYPSVGSSAQSDRYDDSDMGNIVMNNSSPTNKHSVTVNTYDSAVYLTLDKWWTNIFSFVKLNTPITKTESDIIYVSYGYKIV